MNNEEFTDKTRARFRQSVNHLDAATQSRLRQARQSALDQLDRPALAATWRPVGALAALTVAVLVALLWLRPAAPPAPALAQQGEDLEILLADEDLELIADLEFYLWLRTQNHAS